MISILILPSMDAHILISLVDYIVEPGQVDFQALRRFS